MVRAKQAVSRVEETLKPALPPGTSVDTLWSAASTSVDQQNVPLSAMGLGAQAICHEKLRLLELMHKRLIPGDSVPKKDF
jgi:hypothetical protein